MQRSWSKHAAALYAVVHARDIPYVLTGSAMSQDYAVGSPVNEKAVLYIHSHIASHAEFVPSSWALPMLNFRNKILEHLSCHILHYPPWPCVVLAPMCFGTAAIGCFIAKTVSCAGLSQLHWSALEH